MTAWRIREEIIRTVLCCIVYHNCRLLNDMHTHMSSSYSVPPVSALEVRFSRWSAIQTFTFNFTFTDELGSVRLGSVLCAFYTHAVSEVWRSSASVCPRDTTKTVENTITKLATGTVHHES